MMVILRTLGRCVLIISILLRDWDNVRYNNGCNPTSRPLGSWSTVTRDMRRHPHLHATISQGMSIYHQKYRFVPSAVTKINDYKDHSICIVSESVSKYLISTKTPKLARGNQWNSNSRPYYLQTSAVRHANVRLDNVTHFFVRINQALLFCFFMQQHDLL